MRKSESTLPVFWTELIAGFLFLFLILWAVFVFNDRVAKMTKPLGYTGFSLETPPTLPPPQPQPTQENALVPPQYPQTIAPQDSSLFLQFSEQMEQIHRLSWKLSAQMDHLMANNAQFLNQLKIQNQAFAPPTFQPNPEMKPPSATGSTEPFNIFAPGLPPTNNQALPMQTLEEILVADSKKLLAEQIQSAKALTSASPQQTEEPSLEPELDVESFIPPPSAPNLAIKSTNFLTEFKKRLTQKGISVQIDTHQSALYIPKAFDFQQGDSKIEPKQKLQFHHLSKILTELLPCYLNTPFSTPRNNQCPTPTRAEKLNAILIEGHAKWAVAGSARFRNNWKLSVKRGVAAYQTLLEKNPQLGSLRNDKNQLLFRVHGYANKTLDKNKSPSRVELRFQFSSPES
ncbi:MAG: hypothetical protein H7832_11215 [Magnetococcus sp. DMHC-6]